MADFLDSILETLNLKDDDYEIALKKKEQFDKLVPLINEFDQEVKTLYDDEPEFLQDRFDQWQQLKTKMADGINKNTAFIDSVETAELEANEQALKDAGLFGSQTEPQFDEPIQDQQPQQAEPGVNLDEFPFIQEEEKLIDSLTPAEQESVLQPEPQPLSDEEIKKPKNDFSLLRDITIGMNRFNAGLARLPEVVYNTVAIPQNIIADYFDIPSLKVSFEEDITKNPIAEYYEKSVDDLIKLNEQFDRGIFDLFSDGQVENGFKLLGRQVVQNLPNQIAVVASVYLGVPPSAALTGVGAVAAGTKTKELHEVDLPEFKKGMSAFNEGALEAITESLGTFNIAGIGKKMIEKLGKDKAKEAFKETVKETTQTFFEKYYLVTAPLGEAIEEFANNTAQNWSDISIGVNDHNGNIFEGSIDAAIVGFASSTSTTVPVVGVQKATKKIQEKVAEAKEDERIGAKIADEIVQKGIGQRPQAEVKDEGLSEIQKEAQDQGIPLTNKKGDLIPDEVLDRALEEKFGKKQEIERDNRTALQKEAQELGINILDEKGEFKKPGDIIELLTRQKAFLNEAGQERLDELEKKIEQEALIQKTPEGAEALRQDLARREKESLEKPETPPVETKPVEVPKEKATPEQVVVEEEKPLESVSELKTDQTPVVGKKIGETDQTKIVSISPKEKTVTTTDGSVYKYTKVGGLIPYKYKKVTEAIGQPQNPITKKLIQQGKEGVSQVDQIKELAKHSDEDLQAALDELKALPKPKMTGDNKKDTELQRPIFARDILTQALAPIETTIDESVPQPRRDIEKLREQTVAQKALKKIEEIGGAAVAKLERQQKELEQKPTLDFKKDLPKAKEELRSRLKTSMNIDDKASLGVMALIDAQAASDIAQGKAKDEADYYSQIFADVKKSTEATAKGLKQEAALFQDSRTFEKQLKDKYYDLDIELTNNKDGSITLSKIVVPEKGQGVGSSVMQELVDYADQKGIRIYATPSTAFGGSSIKRIKNFNKRFGFIENKGKNKDFSGRLESMYRNPQNKTNILFQGVDEYGMDQGTENQGIFKEGDPLFQGIKGATEFLPDARAIIHGFESADISTAVHELLHVWRKRLSVADNKTLLAEYNKVHLEKKKVIDVQVEEYFARAGERYLREGKTSNINLQELFADFKKWLTQIYRTIKNSAIDVKITPEMRNVYDRMFDADVTPTEQAAANAKIKTASKKGARQFDDSTVKGWVQNQGGIKPADLKQHGITNREDSALFFALARKAGHSLDELAEQAQNDGIIPERSELNPSDNLIQAIRDNLPNLPSRREDVTEEEILKQEYDDLVNQNLIEKELSFEDFKDMQKTMSLDINNLDLGLDEPVRDAEGNILFQLDTGVTETQAFKEWFGDSKVVDDDGKPLVVYRGDFNVKNLNQFQVQEVEGLLSTTSGGIYFSDNPEIAGGYVNKTFIDNSYDAPENFRFLHRGKMKKVSDYVIVSQQLQKKIKDKIVLEYNIPEYRVEQDLKEARGNAVLGSYKSLVETGAIYPANDFETFLKDVFERVIYIDPTQGQKGITPVYLKINKPWIVTNPKKAEDISNLEKILPKNDVTLESIKKKETITLITKDAREALIKLGYDGFQDGGGKITGSDPSTIYIAFESTQIKSATGNRGTFDPNSPNILFQEDIFSRPAQQPSGATQLPQSIKKYIQSLRSRDKKVFAGSYARFKMGLSENQPSIPIPMLPVTFEINKLIKPGAEQQFIKEQAQKGLAAETKQTAKTKLENREQLQEKPSKDEATGQDDLFAQAEKAKQRTLFQAEDQTVPANKERREKLTALIKEKIQELKNEGKGKLGQPGNRKKVEYAKFLVMQYARQTLPSGEFQKQEVLSLLQSLRAAKTAISVANAYDKIDIITKRVQKRIVIGKIKKLVTTAKVKTTKGKSQGKFVAEIQARLDQIIRYMKTPPEVISDIGERVGKFIEDNPQNISDSPGVAELKDQLFYGDFKNADLGRLESIYNELDHLVKTGRELRKAKEEARKERIDNLRSEVLNILKGKKGLRTTTQRLGMEPNKLKEFIDKAFLFNAGWDAFVERLSKFEAGNQFQGKLFDFANLVHDARSAEHAGSQETLKKIQDMAAEIYGSKKEAIKIFRKNSKDKVDLGTFKDAFNEDVQLTLTPNQIYKKWLEKQDHTLDHLFDTMGFTPAMHNAIDNYMANNTKLKRWAEWQLEVFYPQYHAPINKVFADRYGVNLPFNPLYSPIYVEHPDVQAIDINEVMDSQKSTTTLLNGSLKKRVHHKRALKYVDGDKVLAMHVSKMEHFKAWAEIIRDLHAVFNNVAIKNAIEQFHGKTANRTMQGFLEDFTRGDVDRATVINWLDKVRSRFVTSKIAANPTLFLKQLTSLPAFLTELNEIELTTGIIDFLKNPVENTELLFTTEFMKDRYASGFERDIKFALRGSIESQLGGGRNTLETTKNILALPVRIGDMVPILLGGWAVYKRGLKQGKSQEEALKEFARVSKRSQQAKDVEDLSQIQRSGSTGKLFTIFTTAINQYFRLEALAMYRLANRISGKSERGSSIKDIRTIIVTHFVLPAVFQWVASGMPGLLDDWDDEDTEDQLYAMLLGSFNGVLIAGNLVESFIERFQRKPFATQATPLQSILSRGDRIFTEMGKDDPDDIKLMVEVFHSFNEVFTGLPTEPIERLSKGYYDYFSGKTDDVRRLMGYSEFLIKKDMLEKEKTRSRKIKKKQALKRDEAKLLVGDYKELGDFKNRGDDVNAKQENFLDDLRERDKTLYGLFKKELKEAQKELTDVEKGVIRLEKTVRARWILDAINKKSGAERKALYREYVDKGLITPDVRKEMKKQGFTL